MESLIGIGAMLAMFVLYVLGLTIADKWIEKKHGYKVEDLRRPSTLRPRDPPKGQRPQGHPGREMVSPLQVDEDFWIPRFDPLARDEDGHDHFVPDWKCEYCGTMNTSRKACHHCGAPRSESVRVEKVAAKNGTPLPPPE